MSKTLFRELLIKEPSYHMVIDLWIYADGTIGFNRSLPKEKRRPPCDCTDSCFHGWESIGACGRANPLRLANVEEYLEARQKILETNIIQPLPNRWLPALNPGDIVLLEEGLFWLEQDIELIPLTSEQKEILVKTHPGDNDKFIKYCE